MSQSYFKKLLQEIKQAHLDQIRFAAYRCAEKLRFIQQRTLLDKCDLYTLIEVVRLSHLHTLDWDAELAPQRVEAFLCTLYDQLNKRLGLAACVDLGEAAGVLLSWLFAKARLAGTSNGSNSLSVLALKVTLSTLCQAKPVDRMRYHFTLVTDAGGQVVRPRVVAYLKEMLTLPAGVYEHSNFCYHPESCCFLTGCGSLSHFVDVLMVADPPPQPLAWLTVLNKLPTALASVHPVRCGVCHTEPLRGFRYKCRQCPGSFNLCQQCFWSGATAGGHLLEHEVKEYTSWKEAPRRSASLRRPHHQQQQQGHSEPFRRGHGASSSPKYSRLSAALLDPPTNTVDLTHIVPPNPPPAPFTPPPGTSGSLGRPPKLQGGRLAHSLHQVPQQPLTATAAVQVEPLRTEDEHGLIARYAHALHSAGESPLPGNEPLAAELANLRYRRELLESRMSHLQASRADLLTQLSDLMSRLGEPEPPVRQLHAAADSLSAALGGLVHELHPRR